MIEDGYPKLEAKKKYSLNKRKGREVGCMMKRRKQKHGWMHIVLGILGVGRLAMIVTKPVQLLLKTEIHLCVRKNMMIDVTKFAI